MNGFSWQGLIVIAVIIGAIVLLLGVGLPRLFAANEAGRDLQALHDEALDELEKEQDATESQK